MKRVTVTLFAVLLLCALAATPAYGAFGFEPGSAAFLLENEDGSPQPQAGAHPFGATTDFDVTTEVGPKGTLVPQGAVKNLTVHLPPGFVGDPSAAPICSNADFAKIDPNKHPACSDASAVGVAEVRVSEGGPPAEVRPAVYNLPPSPGKAAKLGFVVSLGGVPVTVDIGVSEQAPYRLVATSTYISQAVFFYGSSLTVWGNPASPVHDGDRGACSESDASCPVGLPEKPFITSPTSCDGPLQSRLSLLAWSTGETDEAIPADPPTLTGCDKPFSVGFSAQPTNRAADSPTGLDVAVAVDDEGLRNPGGVAQSTVRRAEVTLPEGMTINPSQAEGLGVCSEADLARETASSAPGEGCPQSSKIGTVEVETPLLEGEVLKGALFVAEPYENRFGSLIAVYMTIKDPELGIGIELAGEVEPDPQTGQLISVFDDLPQLPFSSFRLHFREGGRSPLVTPQQCGSHEVKAVFTPWSQNSPPSETISSFAVDSGPNGGPCPAGGVPPFQPGFEAGSINNAAGAFSPFYMRLTRRDGDQDMTRFSAILPPGLLGRVAGIERCPDAAIAVAKSKSGLEELESPSCPPGSHVGRTLAGAGVGSELTYVPGSLYLAGPVGGAPLSVVSVTPAVAGPFDVGTVVVRVGLTLNPVTGQVQVDGAASDPIPHILKGIPLRLRDLRVYADRPSFMLNPTSCDTFATGATLFGGWLDPFSTADDVPVSLAARYQAAGCRGLGFKPRLAITLEGGVRRSAHPALKAVVTPRPGEANFARAAVTLPRTAFLEQGHIRTICTRVQFAAGGGNGAGCPAGSIYGRARAFTPLLDAPAEGNVYLRANGGERELPDLVVALQGPPSAPFQVELASAIDSVNGGIRSTFFSIPDIPVSRFVLEMQGGKKGLIVNSRHLCFKPKRNRARGVITGQNGRRSRTSPVVRAAGCAKAKKAGRNRLGQAGHERRSAG